jgi:predicted transcriptional regulator
MKVLSLKQPWAELILQGKKKIEIRRWNTKFRGKFLIHSSKNPDNSAMKEFGFDELPLGKILGEAELVEVKKYKDSSGFKKDKNKHLATEDWGNYGFILKKVKKIKPISAKGMLGFWEFN